MRGFMYGATPGDLDHVVITCRFADYALAETLLEQWVRGQDYIGDEFPRPAISRPPEEFCVERVGSRIRISAKRDGYAVSQAIQSCGTRWHDGLEELRCVLDALRAAMDNRLGEVPVALVSVACW